MSLRRTSSLILVAVLLAAVAAEPAFARPNDGRFQKSAEGAKQRATYCDLLKGMLASDEAEADKRAGTKEAKKYADAADKTWAAGVREGCSWAA